MRLKGSHFLEYKNRVFCLATSRSPKRPYKQAQNSFVENRQRAGFCPEITFNSQKTIRFVVKIKHNLKYNCTKILGIENSQLVENTPEKINN